MHVIVTVLTVAVLAVTGPLPQARPDLAGHWRLDGPDSVDADTIILTVQRDGLVKEATDGPLTLRFVFSTTQTVQSLPANGVELTTSGRWDRDAFVAITKMTVGGQERQSIEERYTLEEGRLV